MASANVHLPPDPVTTDPTASAAEPMGFVHEEGAVTITVEVGGKTTRHEVPVELLALRLSDVRTLDKPTGFVKLATPRWASLDDPALATTIVDTWLRADGVHTGAPVQVFFDIATIGAPTGALVVGGAPVEAEVLGAIQVADRRQDVDLRVRFTRPDEDRLVMELVRPARIDLVPFARDTATTALAAALGGAIRAVELQGRLQLVQFEGVTLPNFVRTPVTVATVGQVREKLDQQVDRFQLSQERAESSGLDAALREKVDREKLDKIHQGLRDIARERAGELPPAQ